MVRKKLLKQKLRRKKKNPRLCFIWGCTKPPCNEGSWDHLCEDHAHSEWCAIWDTYGS